MHDERGRPLFRIDVPSHDSPTQWLPPIARLLRRAAGPQERVLLAFDRAGAFPEAMALLRDELFEAVTYERRPFPRLPESAFTQTLHLDQDDVVQFTESRINLGAGRGRLRRVAVREADGRQVNLLAVSELPAERLIRVMRGRWRQENASSMASSDGASISSIGEAPSPIPPTPSCPTRRVDVSTATCVPRPFARATLDACSPCSPTVTDVVVVSSATSSKR